jgi:hypothetical protein
MIAGQKGYQLVTLLSVAEAETKTGTFLLQVDVVSGWILLQIRKVVA